LGTAVRESVCTGDVVQVSAPALSGEYQSAFCIDSN
jgi:hypothetical protein